MAYRPLADEIRPASLDDVVGQKHILGRTAFCAGSSKAEASPIWSFMALPAPGKPR